MSNETTTIPLKYLAPAHTLRKTSDEDSGRTAEQIEDLYRRRVQWEAMRHRIMLRSTVPHRTIVSSVGIVSYG